MDKLNQYDLLLVRRRLPKCVVKTLQTKDVKAFVAGGFIRSNVAHEVCTDVDLFVPDKEMANKLVHHIREGKEHDRFNYVETENAITLYDTTRVLPPIQVITRWFFNEPTKLIECFDFTICQAVVWWEGSVTEEGKPYGNWCSLASSSFYQDLAAKRLVYTSRTPLRDGEAGGSILRVLKYYRRGYTIPIKDLGLVIARLTMGIHRDRWDALLQDEEMLGKVFGGLLREVDPLIDPDHIIKDEEEE